MGNEMATMQMDGVAFDQDEIKRLGKRFKKLDLDGNICSDLSEGSCIINIQDPAPSQLKSSCPFPSSSKIPW